MSTKNVLILVLEILASRSQTPTKTTSSFPEPFLMEEERERYERGFSDRTHKVLRFPKRSPPKEELSRTKFFWLFDRVE